MAIPQQPQTKIADFDLMVSRIQEAMKQLRERGENIYVFLIPLKKDGKNPDVTGKIYESGADENIETPRADCIISPDAARERLSKNIGNVGIVGFKGIYKHSLAFFDFDVEDGHTVIPQEEILRFARENDLFTVRTRNGGIHIYVINDGRFDNAIIEYTGKHAGEIRAHKQYVVAPGSRVPIESGDEKKPTPYATGVYEVIHDGEIKIIANHQLPDWFAIMNAVPRRKLASLKINFEEANPNLDKKWMNDMGMTVEEVCEEEEEDVLEELLLSHQLSHSKFGKDRSRADFYVATRLWWWRFTPQQIVEVMRFYRWYSKTAREDYMEHTVAKACDGPQYKSREELMREAPSILTDAEKHNVETFPEDIPKNRKIVHVRGLPRTGKSYWGLTIIARYREGIYVAPNHEIIEQQFTTFTTRIAPELTSVWLVGKDRACNTRSAAGLTGDCMNCPLRPVNEYAKDEGSEELTTRRYEEYARYALSQYRHLTANLVGKSMPYACPYYLLHFAEKQAQVCFTVPHFTTTSDSITQCTPRKIMVMDEDTVFHHYQPESVTLIEYTVRANGSNAVTLFTPEIMKRLDDLKAFIEDKERVPAWDKIMLRIVETYRAADGLFKTFSDEPKVFGKGVAERKENIVNELTKLDYSFSDISNGMKETITQKLSEYEKEMYVHDDTGLATIFEPMLYPYKQNRFIWIGKNPAALYMVGNKREIIRTPIPSDQYLLIGFTEAELFAKHLIAQGGAKLMREPGQQTLDAELSGGISQLLVRHFPYGKNFILVNIVGNSRTQAKIMRIARAIMVAENRDDQWRAPFMTITSSMKQQQQLWENIPSDEAMMCRKEPIERTYQRYRIGIGAIIYQNSTISRGIDVPWYDIVFVDSCNFAQPYWSAVQSYYENEIERLKSLLRPIEQLSDAEKGILGIPITPPAPLHELSVDKNVEIAKKKDEIQLQLRLLSEEHKETMRIRYSLLMDETTNSALRTSPVPGCGESNTKVIFIKDKDIHLLNPDAKDSMERYEVSENSDIKLVVAATRKMSQKVNPTALCQKTDGEDDLIKELHVPSKSTREYETKSVKSVQRGESRAKMEENLKLAVAANPEIIGEKERRNAEIVGEIVNNSLKPPKNRDKDKYRRTLDGISRSVRTRLKRIGVKPGEVEHVLNHLVRKGTVIVEVERDEATGTRMEYYKYVNTKGDT